VETLRTISAIVGSLLILMGYFRLITDEKGNVNLNNYRFTGGLFLVIGGMLEGASDLLSRNFSKAAASTLAILLGAVLLVVAFSL
jgi:hypothetical protein